MGKGPKEKYWESSKGFKKQPPRVSPASTVMSYEGWASYTPSTPVKPIERHIEEFIEEPKKIEPEIQGDYGFLKELEQI